MEPLSLRIDYSRTKKGVVSRTTICDITVQKGIADHIGEHVKKILASSDKEGVSSVCVITDSVVAGIHGRKLLSVVSEISRKVSLVKFEAGESSKTLATVSKIAGHLDRNGADRNTVLFALGGGVVGDLTGFVASIYKRGVRYFQVPTTLLAQVDSSIGGKTGVDTEWGKNQLGTFYQPRGVFIDPSLLDTLPSSELINGVAEIAKTAIISDKRMFEWLCALKDNIISLPSLKNFIGETCRIKASIVSEDEKEDNLRAILNYGHTVGHAIEASTDFGLSHGRSVILGMLAEGWIAEKMGIFSSEDLERQNELLLRILSGRPSLRSNVKGSNSTNRIVLRTLRNERRLERLALADKKSTASSKTIRMSLPEKIGRMSRTENEGSYRIPVRRELFLESIRYLRSLLEGLRAL
ncbi:MAG TPA: 3-dehydroquinate synthase [Nitrososphaerales archaeon]|nr:3-dehydroquinate synthase [Nitrososphaerales archaeon]